MAIAGERLYVAIDIDGGKAARALKSIDRNMGKTASAAQSLQRSFSKLNGVLGILAGANIFGGMVKNSIDLIDAYNELGGRINLVAKGTVGLTAAQEDLKDVALETYTSFDAVGSLYARLGMATKELGASHYELTQATETVANTLRLSGASAQEARSSMLQLSQALASGKLAGDEYRSISENNVALMDLLADQLNVTRGELKKMSADGLLTTEKVFQALLDAGEKYQKLVESLPITVGRAITNLTTQWQDYLVEFDKATGLTDTLATSIDWLAKNLEKVIKFAKELFTIWAVAKLAAIATAWMKIATAMRATAIWSAAVGGAKAVAGLAAAGAAFAAYESYFGGLSESTLDNMSEQEKKLINLNIELRKAEEHLSKIDALYENQKKAPGAPLENIAKDAKSAREEVEKLQHRIAVLKGEAKPEEDKKDKPTSGTGALREDFSELDRAIKQEIDMIDAFDARVKSLNSYLDEADPARPLIRNLEEVYLLMDEFPQHTDKLQLVADELKKGIEEARSDTNDMLLDMKQGMTDIVVDGIKSMSDAFVDFALTGEQSFAEMTKSILSDITKMILRLQIMNALENSSLGGFLGLTKSADGNVISGGNVVPFAQGGIVSSPTVFPMANGVGLMGEAGPEAIMPLKRHGGRLGVEASGSGSVNNVTVINNSGGESTVTEQPNSQGGVDIQVLIEKSVDRYISSNGANSAFGAQFGARPRPR